VGDVVPFRRGPVDVLEEMILEMADNPLVGIDVFLVRYGDEVVYTTLQPDVAEEVRETLQRLHPGRVYEKLELHLPAAELLLRGR
jgi:hypothetical protein